MSSNLEKAVNLLNSGNYTLAAVNEVNEITSMERGVKPLIKLFDNNIKLKGFSAADKVVGKAAAFLYVLLEVDEIYSKVISRPALAVLEKNNTRVCYDVLTDAIRNRNNTGFCPMETAVIDTEDVDSALILIRKKLDELQHD